MTREPIQNTNAFMATLTITIPDALEGQLIAASKEQGVSTSEIAREAIERDMRMEAWRRLREQFRPYLVERGLNTEEDVLRHMVGKK